MKGEKKRKDIKTLNNPIPLLKNVCKKSGGAGDSYRQKKNFIERAGGEKI